MRRKGPDLITVLLVEDNPGDARLIKELLAEDPSHPVRVKLADRLAVAIDCLSAGSIDVVLLDLSLPDSNGLDTFLSVNAQAPALPIVVLTGLDDEELAAKAMRAGAQDYLPKGRVDSNLLWRALRYAIERKKADLASRRQAAQMRGIIDNMVESVFVCDPQGTITIVNEAALQLSGLVDLDDLRRNLRELPSLLKLRHPGGASVAPEELPIARAIRGETIPQEDMVLYNRRSGRDISIRTSASPIHGDKGEILGAVAVVRDITDLVEVDRMKDGFIAVAAHELKTPVTIMKGYAQALMRAGDRIPGQERKLLQAIDRGSDRITAVVQDMLDISRLISGHLELTYERIDLPALVGEVVDRMALTTAKHSLRLSLAEPVVVRGDRERLEQVVMNLVDNAIRFSPKGGDIEVGISVRAGEALVFVRDRGVGIPQQGQANIFQRFYSAHAGTPNDYSGMGVGLHISREIISRHGGRMFFESVEGEGSTFYFSLPLPKR